MQLGRCAGKAASLLVLGFAVLIVGCGSRAQQGSTRDAAAKIIAADMRKEHQALKALKKAGARPEAGAMKRGRFRAKSGP